MSLSSRGLLYERCGVWPGVGGRVLQRTGRRRAGEPTHAPRRAHGVLRRQSARGISAAAGGPGRRAARAAAGAGGREPGHAAGRQPAGPRARRLVRALESRGMQQRASLREIGDVSLFISGFFSDSLRRKLVDVDYYVSIGGSAYTALSRIDADALSPVFGELAEHFGRFVDILSEGSERTSCTSNAG